VASAEWGDYGPWRLATRRTWSYAKPVPVAPLVDRDLVSRRVLVRDKDVVFVKGIFEASDGLGALFAEKGGELIISAPLSRERELDELLADLQTELQAHVSHLPLPTVP